LDGRGVWLDERALTISYHLASEEDKTHRDANVRVVKKAMIIRKQIQIRIK